MIRKFVFITCVACLSSTLAAEVLESEVLRQRNVASVSISAFPLAPAISQVSYTRTLLSITPATRATLSVWYLSTTPYFVPGPFYEVGVAALLSYQFEWGLVLQSGFGTAIFDEQGLFGSNPFVAIIPLSVWYPVSGNRWIASLHSETLVYSNGFIVDAEIGINYAVIPARLSIGLAGGVNLGHHSIAGQTAAVPKTVLTVAVGF
jgi:hypothetical protein